MSGAAPDRLDLGSLRQGVSSLAAAVAAFLDSTWLDSQSETVREVMLAGVIQNFEFAYELSVKSIRRQLELESASPAEVDESSFRDVLRSAAERGILADVEAWFGYRKMRNMTSHTYDRSKAREVWQGIPRFLEEAQRLLAVLEARNG